MKGGLFMTQETTKKAEHNSPQPIRGNEGAPIIGPTNPAREAESRDRLAPPSTDHGTLPSLKWSFADCPGAELRQHAAQGRRGPGNALAQARRVGLRDQRPNAGHRDRW